MERPEHCPICLDDLGNVEPLRVCGHFMHKECLSKHFKQECVICKAPQLDVKVTGHPPRQEYALLNSSDQINNRILRSDQAMYQINNRIFRTLDFVSEYSAMQAETAFMTRGKNIIEDIYSSSDESLSTSSEDYPDEDLYHPSWD